MDYQLSHLSLKGIPRSDKAEKRIKTFSFKKKVFLFFGGKEGFSRKRRLQLGEKYNSKFGKNVEGGGRIFRSDCPVQPFFLQIWNALRFP